MPRGRPPPVALHRGRPAIAMPAGSLHRPLPTLISRAPPPPSFPLTRAETKCLFFLAPAGGCWGERSHPELVKLRGAWRRCLLRDAGAAGTGGPGGSGTFSPDPERLGKWAGPREPGKFWLSRGLGATGGPACRWAAQHPHPPRPRGVMGSSSARPPPPASPRTLFPASWKELARCVERAGSPGPGSASEMVARSQGSPALPPPGQGKECPRVAPWLGARELGVLLEAS